MGNINRVGFSLGVSLLALIFALISLIGLAGTAWIFYQQRELPGQIHAPSLLWDQVAPVLPVSEDLKDFSDARDRFAVLQSQIQVLNSQVSHLNSEAIASGNINHWLTNPAAIAKLDLHCALAELSLGGNLDLSLKFLNEARDELILASRPNEVALLDNVINHFSSKKTQVSPVLFEKLEQGLSKLSFVLPISANDFAASVPPVIHSSNESAWKSAWEETSARIQSLVIIRDNQTVGEGLITESDREASLAAILFNLKEAEAEMNAGQWSLFENALNLVKTRVQVNFQDNAARSNYLDLLNTMSAYPPAIQENLAKQAVLKVLDSLEGVSL